MEPNYRYVDMELKSRDKVLSRIKRGLYGRTNDDRSGPERIAQNRDRSVKYGRSMSADSNLEHENHNLVEMFTNELGKVNGVSRVLNDEDKLREYMSKVTLDHDSKSCIVWETPLIQHLKVIEHLKANGLRIIKSQDKTQLATADIGITEADYAIADSGTLVLFSSPKKPRLVSLIAPIHIAIVDSKKIVRNIFALFQSLKYQSDIEIDPKHLISCIAFITGPSRTADIELNLTLGVHGPKELHILIYNK